MIKKIIGIVGLLFCISCSGKQNVKSPEYEFAAISPQDIINMQAIVLREKNNYYIMYRNNRLKYLVEEINSKIKSKIFESDSETLNSKELMLKISEDSNLHPISSLSKEDMDFIFPKLTELYTKAGWETNLFLEGGGPDLTILVLTLKYTVK